MYLTLVSQLFWKDSAERLVGSIPIASAKGDKMTEGKDPRFSYAPWTDKEVENLNIWQDSGYWHSWTCGLWEMTRKTTKEDCSGQLVATNNGWTCPKCRRYTQNFAFKFMVNFDLKEYKKKAEEEILFYKSLGIKLDKEDVEQIIESIENPPEPNTKAIEAAKRYKELFKENKNES